MIRILISTLLFYFGAAMVFGTLAEIKYNSSGNRTLSETLKGSVVFFGVALFLFISGLLVWPNRELITIPRYYVGQVLRTQNEENLKVRIKEELKSDEIALIVTQIKNDNSHLKCNKIEFFLPEQAYNDKPYAAYNYSNDDEVWDQVFNKLINRPSGIAILNSN